MNSRVRPSFWRAYAKLDAPTKAAARRTYALFAADPGHPSLRFKKLAGYDNVWSVRVNAQYRVIGERTGDTISWAWIGTHNEFDKLFG